MKSFIEGAFVMIGFLLTATFIHEFGHYLMLRIFDIPVKEFSIGVGPLLYQKKKKTVWSFRVFPFMAYVDFNLEEDYLRLKLWKKLLILSAGIISNILLGLIYFCINPYTFYKLPLLNNIKIGIGPFSFLILISYLTRSGLAATLSFLSFFSIWIGIINAIPLPGLDGGWILTTLIRIPEKKYESITEKSIRVFKTVSLLLCFIDLIWLIFQRL